MLTRLIPWAIGLFVLYLTLTEPAVVGHFLGWAGDQILLAFGQLAKVIGAL